MLEKKNPQKNLENKRWTYLLFGLVLSLGFSLAAINWKTSPSVTSFTYDQVFEENDDIVIPITEIKVKPIPPKVILPEKIEIIEKDIPLSEVTLEFDDWADDDFVEIDDPEDETVDEVISFVMVSYKPVFPGCELVSKEELGLCFQQQVLADISRKFKYPAISLEMNVQEKIYVSFEISKKGKVRNVKVVKGNDPDLKKEAVRLIKSLPDMRPAYQGAKPVAVSFTIPISFSLN